MEWLCSNDLAEMTH